VDRWCEADSGGAARLIMQVHDELVLEVRTDAVELARHAVSQCMIDAGRGALRVPLKVEIGVGSNWDEAH
jgi:DNA polymerase-1